MSGKISNTFSYRELVDEEESSSFLEKTTSIFLPVLLKTEKHFFDLVTSGNIEAVHNFLLVNRDFNINCVNFQGVSALHVAIKKHNESMVEYLLNVTNINIGDSALHAIRKNNANILLLILDKLGNEFEAVGHSGESSDFPDHITPLMLAADLGHYELIEILLERGHRLSKPHLPNCCCSTCAERLNSDDLLHAQTRRLTLYRAISNPAYICHTSDDLILTSFELSHELELCASAYPEFRSAYTKLSETTSNFAVDLIRYCRSTHEVELVLKQRRGISGQFLYPRLVLAMDYRQKAFVSHPNTQQVLETTWSGDWCGWHMYGPVTRAIVVLFRGLLLPLITIAYIFVPGHSSVQRLSLPVNKMISHVASYVIFLALIFAQSNANQAQRKHGPTVTGLEPFLALYVLGFIWSSFRMAIVQGPRRYFRMLWNWYDLIMLFLFVNTFLFWTAAYLDTRSYTDVERKYWYYLDPTLIAEGLFCFATIMAFFRLLFLCQLSYHLGPLQISLGKMSLDIAKFIIIFTVIIISFTAGLCKLYQYYDGMVQVDPASGLKIVQQSSFVDFPSTLKTLFWALFCMSPIESADVIIENLPGDVEGTSIINRHLFTEAVGYISFACFEVVCVIVILNMLIATMSNTFQRVTDNVDIEWTFGRVQVYLKYMRETTLPPPFNLILAPQGVLLVIEWIRIFFYPVPEKMARWSIHHCCYIEKKTNFKILKEYPVLMSQLVQRYFRDKEDMNYKTEEFNSIKQELLEIKELLKMLNK